jgi:3',5'-cyclic-AMP phosphodiesterase
MVVTVLQLSDTHLRATPGDEAFGRDPDEQLARVLAAWVATGEVADLVLLTGDLADDASVAGSERLADAVAALGAPVLAIPGNHDVPDVVATTWGTTRVTRIDTWQVVGIDTTIPGQVHGRVDVAATMAELDALEPVPTVLALHHPPVSRSTGEEFQLEGAGELLAALVSRPHVRVIVAGHLHDAVDLAAPSGLPVLGCPSTLIGIVHDGDRMELAPHAPVGARVLHLEDDGTCTTRILQI